MELTDIALHIEALIFASDRPLAVSEITELVNTAFGFLEQTFSEEDVEELIESIKAKYSLPDFPFTIQQNSGGWQFLTKPDYHKTIALLYGEKFFKRLSSAAMETLSIVAYKQPVTKGEIESIRGVNSDYSIQKLLEKELVIISGRSEELPGKPLLYITSRTFMDYFGINSVNDLPKIKEVLSEQPAEPTMTNEEQNKDETLAINKEGDLIAALPDDNNDVKGDNDVSPYS